MPVGSDDKANAELQLNYSFSDTFGGFLLSGTQNPPAANGLGGRNSSIERVTLNSGELKRVAFNDLRRSGPELNQTVLLVVTETRNQNAVHGFYIARFITNIDDASITFQQVHLAE